MGLVSRIGRALTAGANAAAPFVAAEQAARLQERRDARLAELADRATANNQAFQKEMATRSEEFQREQAGTGYEQAKELAGMQHGYRMAEAEPGLQLTREQNDRLAKYQEAQLQLQGLESKDNQKYRTEMLAMQKRQLEVTEKGAELARQLGQLDITLKAEELAKTETFNRFVNSLDAADPVTRQIASDALAIMSGKSPYEYIQLRDSRGNYDDRVAIFGNGGLRSIADVSNANVAPTGLVDSMRPQAPAAPAAATPSPAAASPNTRPAGSLRIDPSAPTGSKTNPYRPTTNAEYAQVKSGEWYIHPENGLAYVKE